LTFSSSYSTIGVTVGTERKVSDSTAAIVKDGSGNTVPNSSLIFSVVSDTSELFSNGLSINNDGQIIGVPVDGDTGTFCVKASGRVNTD
jgi:hypothetical protein